ncbi:MAG: polyprenyl synthetase family protein [Acidobacteria bacterium]|nr:polyprenyl synthetase family protein [Acidobacteriota bacterium]
MALEEFFQTKRELVDAWLERLLPPESTPPPEVHRAMRYSVFAGGKRLRPILVIAAGEGFDAPEESLLPVGCAIEMIHTYSLIHDDLPAMDDDDFRRGKPTCHKVFGEALAILAGDALLTRAFQTLANAPINADSTERKVRLIFEIAAAAGTVGGMVGGQVMDILSEAKPIDATMLDAIHRAKTGTLICASVRAGGLLGGATEKELQLLTKYGERIGLAFQIVDDLLDLTATSDQLGKTAGKDRKVGKATYPSLYGIEASRARGEELIREAIAAAQELERPYQRLVEIAWFILERNA